MRKSDRAIPPTEKAERAHPIRVHQHTKLESELILVMRWGGSPLNMTTFHSLHSSQVFGWVLAKSQFISGCMNLLRNGTLKDTWKTLSQSTSTTTTAHARLAGEPCLRATQLLQVGKNYTCVESSSPFWSFSHTLICNNVCAMCKHWASQAVVMVPWVPFPRKQKKYRYIYTHWLMCKLTFRLMNWLAEGWGKTKYSIAYFSASPQKRVHDELGAWYSLVSNGEPIAPISNTTPFFPL